MKKFNSLFSQSSLVPLAKIANAPSRSLRLLWAVFTATMFVVLCSCITLVVIQYCRHQTVFQLDYSGRNVLYDQVPGFTICPQIQEAKRLFNEVMDVEPTQEGLSWLDKSLLDKFRNRARALRPHLTTGAIVHRLPPGQLYWDTNTIALSQLYGILQNFSVRFRMQPARMEMSHRLTVMEQVPNVKHFLCTTFELRSHYPAASSWSYLEIELNQSISSKSSQFTAFTLILHERGELPFSAYERHIQTGLAPGTEVSLYVSKSVTSRLNTERNPCFDSPSVRQRSTTSVDTKEAWNDFEQEMNRSGWKASEKIPDTWELDYLDQLRMEDQRHQSSAKFVDHYTLSTSSSAPRRESSHQHTVRLFGTHFFYSREACGWAECSRKVRQVCNCSSSIEMWAYKMNGCENVTACERAECQEKKISYNTCPLSCVLTKFVKHNTIVEAGNEANVEPGKIRVKLVRSEAVQVATEEEIFSLAKLFSEVGGLCSLFIGFSCIFLFELIEAMILMRRNSHRVGGETGTNLSTEKNSLKMCTRLQESATNLFVDGCHLTRQNGMVGHVWSLAESPGRNECENPGASDNVGVGEARNLPEQNENERELKPRWADGILLVPVIFSAPGLLIVQEEEDSDLRSNCAPEGTNFGEMDASEKSESLILFFSYKLSDSTKGCRKAASH
ncbi:Na channel amiloride sensitive [Fasciola gigantica]|uniref:Na channel amiloride sensitive n=1 Tax=Fasciola gigantica TaxID=46835 RepID=A0A504YR73_FASGI|nr:Na channel amiloride sensitive [Fasciola gigantica]